MITFTSICLLALLSLVAGFPTGQHGIEKQQNTETIVSDQTEHPRRVTRISANVCKETAANYIRMYGLCGFDPGGTYNAL